MSNTFAAIEEEKKRLSQRKARLQQKETLLKIKERKLQLSHQIRVGELAEKSGIHTLDHPTMLGAFLFIQELSQNENQKNEWLQKGQNLLDSAQKEKVSESVS
jgi:hypothetical protein